MEKKDRKVIILALLAFLGMTLVVVLANIFSDRPIQRGQRIVSILDSSGYWGDTASYVVLGLFFLILLFFAIKKIRELIIRRQWKSLCWGGGIIVSVAFLSILIVVFGGMFALILKGLIPLAIVIIMLVIFLKSSRKRVK